MTWIDALRAVLEGYTVEDNDGCRMRIRRGKPQFRDADEKSWMQQYDVQLSIGPHWEPYRRVGRNGKID